jgi:type IV secretion system protein VirB8
MDFNKKTSKVPKDVPSQMNWEYDLVLQERRSRQLAWRVAVFASAVALLSLLTLIVILPLKEVVPYIVKVDDVTGDASIIQSAASHMNNADINDKHWLKRFVIARDRYHYNLLQADFDFVKNLSGDNVFRDYAAQFSEPLEIQEKYKDQVKIIPEILSITITRKGYATVRYQVTISDRRVSEQPLVQKKIATISYFYDVKRTGTSSEMIDNPLGFTVNGYQTETEFETTQPTESKS